MLSGPGFGHLHSFHRAISPAEVLISKHMKERNSSIELLKIVAMLMIIISHWVQTLYYDNSYVDFNDYILPLHLPTSNIQQYTLTLLKYFGVLGNNIFLIASSWFLLNDYKLNYRRIITLEFDVYIVSLLCLFSFSLFWMNDLSTELVIKSFMPTLMANNWFITCYFLLYFAHIHINRIITNSSERELKYTCLTLIFFYGIFQMIIAGALYSSKIIEWISIYLCVGYMKIYKNEFVNSYKKNIILLLFSAIAILSIIFFTNIWGMLYPEKALSLLKWDKDYNVFLIFISFSLFNIARTKTFTVRWVNFISASLFLVYILHENVFVRYYLRPFILEEIYNAGYYCIIIEVILLLSMATWIICIITSCCIKYIVKPIENYLIIKCHAYCHYKL